MASNAELILRTLDHSLTGPGRIRLLGGAALILVYGRERSTDDAALVMDGAEVQALVDMSGFSEAVEATNAELEPRGLSLTHIWARSILTPSWRSACRVLQLEPPFAPLSVEVPGPADLITSKLARGDDGDLDDVMHLMRVEHLSAEVVSQVIDTAVVPELLREGFSTARSRLEARLARSS
ncbi:MAG: DUF6036 family nucleotidyltransferase [Myxococcaceae bacterium]|nr:DUF6036 family nucleotidyltransferase [Myxococcaceae bacterium]